MYMWKQEITNKHNQVLREIGMKHTFTPTPKNLDDTYIGSDKHKTKKYL